MTENQKLASYRWRAKNREHWLEYSRAYSRKWRRENPERHRASRRKYDTPERVRECNLLKNYGVTLKEYEELLIKQNGVCALCFSEPSPARRLAVDHDHQTNKIRGLLCVKCNPALHNLEKDISWGNRAMSYLNKYREVN